MSEQQSEEDKICPLLNSPCIKEKCRRYSSMQVVETKLGVPMQKTIYTCLDNIYLGLLQTLVNLMGSSLAQQQMKDMKGLTGIQGLDLSGPRG